MEINHGTGFYLNLLKIIDEIENGKLLFSYEEGMNISGNHWTAIVDMLVDNYVGIRTMRQGFRVKQQERVFPIREDCLEAIDIIRKSEYDRELSNTESIENIKYGRKGYRLSIIAIIISGIAILLETAKWIAQLCR